MTPFCLRAERLKSRLETDTGNLTNSYNCFNVTFQSIYVLLNVRSCGQTHAKILVKRDKIVYKLIYFIRLLQTCDGFELNAIPYTYSFRA